MKRMEFNREKFEVLYLGKKNVRQKYRMGEIRLGSNISERNLDALVSHKIIRSQQGDVASKKQRLTEA